MAASTAHEEDGTPYLSWHDVPSAPRVPKDLPNAIDGLLSLVVVRDPTRSAWHLLATWRSRADHDSRAGILCDRIEKEGSKPAFAAGGFVAEGRMRRKPTWARISLGNKLIYLAAVIGAWNVLHPALYGLTDTPEIKVTRLGVVKTDLGTSDRGRFQVRITNASLERPVRVTLGAPVVVAEDGRQLTDAAQLDAQPVLGIEPFESVTVGVVLDAMPPGAYESRLPMQAKSGLLASEVDHTHRESFRVWEDHRVAVLSAQKLGSADCEISGSLEVGAFIGLLDMKSWIERTPGVLLQLVVMKNTDSVRIRSTGTPGAEVSMIRWRVRSRKVFSSQQFRIQASAQPDFPCAELAQKVRVELEPSHAWGRP